MDFALFPIRCPPPTIVNAKCFEFLLTFLGLSIHQVTFRVVAELLPLHDAMLMLCYRDPNQSNHASLIDDTLSNCTRIEHFPEKIGWRPMEESGCSHRRSDFESADAALSFFFRSQLARDGSSDQSERSSMNSRHLSTLCQCRAREIQRQSLQHTACKTSEECRLI